MMSKMIFRFQLLRFAGLALCISLVLSAPLSAALSTSDNYTLTSESFAPGGVGVSSNYTANANLEPISGKATSAGYEIRHGLILTGVPLPTAKLPGNIPAPVPETPENWTGNETEADGSYAGLLSDANGDAMGYLSLKLSSSGGLSGSILYEGLKLGFKGTIASDGTYFAALIDSKSGRNFNFSLQLQSTPNGFRLGGTLAEGVVTCKTSMDHAGFDKKTDPSPMAGTYTTLTPADPLNTEGSTHPQGDGWGTVTIATDGKVTYAGELGDATKLTLSGVVSKDGTWRVFKELYSSKPLKGVFAGTVAFRDVPNVSCFDGVIHWVKRAYEKEKLYPNGFEMDVRMIGSEYGEPFPGELMLTQFAKAANNAAWMLGEGNVEASNPGRKSLTWGAQTVAYTPAGTEKLAVKPNAKNGSISGSYVDKAAGMNLKFNGVAFPRQGIVAGNFVGNGEAGYFVIEPVGGPTLQVRSFPAGLRMLNGDSTPDSADGTDFGDAGVDGGYAERSFRLQNTGTGNLFILEAPTVTGAGFSLLACRVGPVAPGEETVMTIRFDPAVLGAAGGIVSIASNDEDYHPFTFSIQGKGIAGGLIDLGGAGTSWAGIAPGTPAGAPAGDPVGYSEPQNATYFGLLQVQDPEAQIPGITNLKLGKGGAFSGTLEMSGSRESFRGTFAADGSAVFTIRPSSGGKDLVVALQLHQISTGSSAFRIRGTVTQGTRVYDLDLMRNDFTKANPTPKAGTYTMLVVANDELGLGFPTGEGAIVLSVGIDGKITATGVLGDGERFSNRGFLSADAEWALFQSLYQSKPRGYVAGVLTFRDVPDVSDFDGVLQWLRLPDRKSKTYPFGFKQRVAAVGSAYVVQQPALTSLPSFDGNARLTLEGGGFNPAPGPFAFTWRTDNKLVYVPAATESLSLQINAKSGQFSAKFANKATGQKISAINGVIFQKQQAVSGNFAGSDRNGRMTVTAN